MNINPTICGNKRIYFSKRTPCDECEPEPTRLPEYIRITILPSKLQYADDESVDINGIEVRAYYGDDSEWGVVPFRELDWNPKVAEGTHSDIYVKSGIRCIKVSADTFVDKRYFAVSGVGYYYYPYSLYRDVTSQGDSVYHFWGRETAGDIYLTRYNDPNNGMRLYSVTSDFPRAHGASSYYNDVDHNGMGHSGVYYFGRGVWLFEDTYGTSLNDAFDYEWIPESTEDPRGKSFENATPEGSSTTQEITVSWDRGDGVILTDTYEITVTA